MYIDCSNIDIGNNTKYTGIIIIATDNISTVYEFQHLTPNCMYGKLKTASGARITSCVFCVLDE